MSRPTASLPLRSRLTVGSLALALTVAIGGWLGPVAASDARPASAGSPAVGVSADNALGLHGLLEQHTAQELLAALLHDAPNADIAAAFRFYLGGESADRAEIQAIVENATVAAPDRFVEAILADDNGDSLAALLGDADALGPHCDPWRFLGALRMWLFDAPRQGRDLLPISTAVEFATTALGLSEMEVEDSLTQPLPWNQIPRRIPSELTGRVESVNGMRVLTLWGTPFERGYAYGKLLGPTIVRLWRSFVLPVANLRGQGGGYNRICELQNLVFEFPPHIRTELKGIVAGIRQTMTPDELWVESLGREVGLVDLMAGNTLSDWQMFGCSSISVWGDRTSDGRVLTARNLDYLAQARLLAPGHLMLVHAPMPLPDGRERRGWAGMTFTGFVGCLTAMNEDGVTASIHDTNGYWSTTYGALPRPFQIRQALETADPAMLPDSFAGAFRNTRGLTPGNIHVSWPREHGREGMGQAAALEFDGYSPIGRGVTIRTIAQNDESLPDDIFAVTNHHCLRYQDGDEETPESRGVPGNSGDRLETLETRAANAEAGSITPEILQSWLQEVGHPGTIHSVIFEPDARQIHAFFPRMTERGAPWSTSRTFDLRAHLQQLDARLETAASE